MDVLLRRDEPAQLRVSEEPAELRLVVALDDEILIERVDADLDVLHAEGFPEVAEEGLAIDREAKAVWIDVRRSHAREDYRRVAGGDGIRVERDGPRAVGRDDLVAFREATF